MPQYLLSIYQPDGGTPDAGAMARIAAGLHRLNEELRDTGSWVFTGGLHAASSATVVRADGMITDGPFAESKEQIGGFWVIKAADLDAALDVAGRGSAACRRPVEVRPFQDEPAAE